MSKEWDLNIFFEELDGETSAEVLSINPVIWSNDDGRTNNDYTDIVYTTTFAEARYLRSQYPENEYGYDWTDTLDHFMEIAPPRLKSLLGTLPSPYEYKDLVG